MESFILPSGEGFEDYCLRTFKCFLRGELFPYSLRETYTLVFTSWDEAVKELLENGVEGFSYQKCPDGDDYFLCMYGFTQHVVMQDKSLELLACFCDTTYRQQMSIFDIPVHYETRCEKKADGKMRIVQVPINGYQPKVQDPRYNGFMEGCGDLYTRICYARFIQDSGFTRSTSEIAEAFGMPEEGLLCTLKQNGIIVEKGDDEEDGWEMAEALKDRGLTMVKTGADGKPETQWTYKGGYLVWLLLTKDCKVRPCFERYRHE
jgi:hypothetical protein